MKFGHPEDLERNLRLQDQDRRIDRFRTPEIASRCSFRSCESRNKNAGLVDQESFRWGGFRGVQAGGSMREGVGQGWAHLDRQVDLLLPLELVEHRDHVHLQQPQDVRPDELLELLVVVLEPLQAEDHEEGLLSDELLPPPQRPPRTAVVVRPIEPAEAELRGGGAGRTGGRLVGGRRHQPEDRMREAPDSPPRKSSHRHGRKLEQGALGGSPPRR